MNPFDVGDLIGLAGLGALLWIADLGFGQSMLVAVAVGLALGFWKGITE